MYISTDISRKINTVIIIFITNIYIYIYIYVYGLYIYMYEYFLVHSQLYLHMSYR